MGKIIIGKIKKEYSEFGCRLYGTINRDGENFVLFFDYSIQDIDKLDNDFADPFLISILPYAMNKKYDIHCDNPISSDLFYNIVFDYIPCMSKYTKYFNKIEIEGTIQAKNIKNNDAVVTGASCGVDSMYSIFSIINNTNFVNDSRLSHLLVMNSGACSWTGGEESYYWFLNESKKSEKLAKDLGLGFISVNTNLMEFYDSDHRISNYCRMAGVIMGIDKMIKKYHFASGYELNEFTLNPKDKDDGYYAYYICKTLSDFNIHFYLTANSLTRTQRLKYFSDNVLASKYLNVCVNNSENCGYCEKCLRTMGALYSIDKLDLFRDSFNVDEFYKKKTRLVAQMRYYRKFHRNFYDFMRVIKKKEPFMYLNATILYFFYYNPIFTFSRYGKIIIKKIFKRDSRPYIFFNKIYRKYSKRK